MSHHLFTTQLDQTEVTVVAGWSCVQQGYFMSITKKCESPDHSQAMIDELIFNHMTLHTPYPTQIITYLQALDALGIELPAHMVIELLRDGVSNNDTKYIEHQISHGRYVRHQIH